jgi:hypothetical protein
VPPSRERAGQRAPADGIGLQASSPAALDRWARTGSGVLHSARSLRWSQRLTSYFGCRASCQHGLGMGGGDGRGLPAGCLWRGAPRPAETGRPCSPNGQRPSSPIYYSQSVTNRGCRLCGVGSHITRHGATNIAPSADDRVWQTMSYIGRLDPRSVREGVALSTTRWRLALDEFSAI